MKAWIGFKKQLPVLKRRVLVKWKDHKRRIHIDIGVRYIGLNNSLCVYIFDVNGSRHLDDSELISWQKLPSK